MPHRISVPDAAHLLGTVNRVMVIGVSGGGKTTLALKISERFDLAYQSLDRDARWLPGWRKRDRQEQRDIIAGLVAAPRWVMDGSGASTFDLRLPRTELIIWMRPPRHRALMALAGRVWRNYGTVRVAMAEGCPEPVPDLDFLSYIWQFEHKHAPLFVKQIDTYAPEVPVVTLRTRDEAARLLGKPDPANL